MDHRRLHAGIVTAITLFGALAPTGALASSHREAPMISQDPSADATDLYAFRSPESSDKIILIGNHYPLTVPGAGPNYYRFGDGVVYAFHIDNDGDAEEDVTYAITFKTTVGNGNTFLFTTQVINNLSDANVRQHYTVYRIEGKFRGNSSQLSSRNVVGIGEVATPPIGIKSQPNYEALAQQAVITATGDRRFFAGSRDDPFFVDLNVFDLLNLGAGFDSLKGTNVQSIVMELPMSDLVDDDSVIGVWTANYRSSIRVLRGRGREEGHGKLVQVSRLGMPLVNEVVVPLAFKDFFNNSHPEDDADTPEYAEAVLRPELARLFRDVLGLDVPTENRTDLVTVFLTGVPGLNQPEDVQPAEMLRINTDTPATPIGAGHRLGVFGGDTGGFPNGRRLADDVTDIAVQAVAGKLVPGYTVPESLGDGVDANDKAFQSVFPFLALPHTQTN